MSEYKRHIIKNITAYSICRYISQFLGFFIAILIRRFLGPLYTGMWGVMGIVLSYSGYIDLGVSNAIAYKIPFYNGRGEKDESERIKNIVFSFLSLTTIIASVVVMLLVLILKTRMPKELFVGFLIFPLFLIAQRLYAYYIMLLRAHKEFIILGKSYLFDSAVNLLLIFLLVYKFKLYGIYMVGVLLPLLNVLYMRVNIRYSLRFEIVWKKVKEYIRFGFPIFLSSFSMVMLYTVDRIMIVKMLGLIPLGYYSIAIMTRTYTTEFSQNFASVFSPYFIEDYGKSGDISGVGHKIVKYTEASSCIMAITLGCVYIVCPILIHYALPKFEEGIDAMKIMLLCTFFVTIAAHMKNLLIMKERQVTVMYVTFFAVALNAVMNYVMIKTGFGISGVAGASSIAAFLLFIAVSWLFCGHVKDLSFLLYLTRVLFPLIYSAFALYLLKYITLVFPIYEVLARLAVFLAASVIPIFYMDKRTHAVTLAKEMLVEKIRGRIIDNG